MAPDAQRAEPRIDVTGKHGSASGSLAAQRDQSIRQYVSDAIEARAAR